MKRQILSVRLVLAISILAIGTTANASITAYLKIGDIKGESQAAGHEDEIDVLSWSWGVTRVTDEGDGSIRTRGTTEVHDLVISKVLEKSTPKLFEACVKGSALPDATLVIERSSETGGSVKYFEIKLTNVNITSASLSGSVEAFEDVTMSFEVVEMIYTVRNPDGTSAGNVEMTYDVAAGE